MTRVSTYSRKMELCSHVSVTRIFPHI